MKKIDKVSEEPFTEEETKRLEEGFRNVEPPKMILLAIIMVVVLIALMIIGYNYSTSL